MCFGTSKVVYWHHIELDNQYLVLCVRYSALSSKTATLNTTTTTVTATSDRMRCIVAKRAPTADSQPIQHSRCNRAVATKPLSGNMVSPIIRVVAIRCWALHLRKNKRAIVTNYPEKYVVPTPLPSRESRWILSDKAVSSEPFGTYHERRVGLCIKKRCLQ